MAYAFVASGIFTVLTASDPWVILGGWALFLIGAISLTN